MAYGHAERALATIRLLEAETRALLNSLPELDAEQRAWLSEVNGAGPQLAAGRLPAGDASGRTVAAQVVQ